MLTGLHTESMSLYTPEGHRKYLTAEEQRAFVVAASRAAREVRTFCSVLVYTGCRLSEALALTADRIDVAASVVIFETLKKRRRGIYRAVPVPPTLIEALDLVHDIRKAQKRRVAAWRLRLWPWSRMTGWRRVQEVMHRAEIHGAHATPKGLRHSFGVAAVGAGIPLNMLQKWLGHASMTTTAIYVNAVGEEEQHIAARLWEHMPGVMISEYSRS